MDNTAICHHMFSTAVPWMSTLTCTFTYEKSVAMMHQVLITVNESPVDAGQVLSTRLNMIQAGKKNDLI